METRVRLTCWTQERLRKQSEASVAATVAWRFWGTRACLFSSICVGASVLFASSCTLLQPHCVHFWEILTPSGHERILCISRSDRKEVSWWVQAPRVESTHSLPQGPVGAAPLRPGEPIERPLAQRVIASGKRTIWLGEGKSKKQGFQCSRVLVRSGLSHIACSAAKKQQSCACGPFFSASLNSLAAARTLHDIENARATAPSRTALHFAPSSLGGKKNALAVSSNKGATPMSSAVAEKMTLNSASACASLCPFTIRGGPTSV